MKRKVTVSLRAGIQVWLVVLLLPVLSCSIEKVLQCPEEVWYQNKDCRRSLDTSSDTVVFLGQLIVWRNCLRNPCYSSGSRGPLLNNGIPFGDYNLDINSSSVTAYSKTVQSGNFVYTLGQALQLVQAYEDANQDFNANILSLEIDLQVYFPGNNTFIQYDGVDTVEIFTDKIYPSNETVMDGVLYLKLANLGAGDFNVPLVINSTTPERQFEISFAGNRYKSNLNASSVSVIIPFIPVAGQTVPITVQSSTIYFAESGIEFATISGSIIAHRQ